MATVARQEAIFRRGISKIAEKEEGEHFVIVLSSLSSAGHPRLCFCCPTRILQLLGSTSVPLESKTWGKGAEDAKSRSISAHLVP